MMNKLATTIFAGVLMSLCVTIAAGQRVSIDKQLQGYWKSNEALIEFRPGSKVTVNDDQYEYAVVGKSIIIGNDQGQMEFPFTLSAGVLTVWAEGRKVVYTRLTDEELAAVGNRSAGGGQRSNGGGGGVSQDLVGKWCYSANVNASGGGRQSDLCFTLNSNGTYEYSGATSNSNIYGGSNSSSQDSGRWSATSNSLTARSNSGTTTTYTLERRNHPKTGDPMLMVDGDAFVTHYQKRPW